MLKVFKILLIMVITVFCSIFVGVGHETGHRWLSFIFMVAWGCSVSAIWKYKSNGAKKADEGKFEIDKKID